MSNNKRWMIVFWIFVINMIAYMDRINLAVAAPVLMTDLNISPSQMGLIMSAFLIGYAALNFLGGIIADRFSPGKMLAVITIFWSLMTFMTGMAWSFLSFMIIRIIFGMCEGPLPTVNSKLVNNWVLPNERGTASGLWLVAMMLGTFIGAPLSSLIISKWGWHYVFYLFAAVGLLLGVLIVRTVKSRPEDNKSISDNELKLINDSISEHQTGQLKANIQPLGLGAVLRNPWSWAFAIAYSAGAFLFWANMTWLPTYFVKARGTTLLKAGIYAGLPYLLGMFGPMLFGLLSDKLTKGWRSPWNIVSQIIIVPAVILAVNAPTVELCLLGFCVAIFLQWATIPLTYAMIMDLFPANAVASVTGFMIMWGSVAGIISPIIVGYIYESTGSFNKPYYYFLIGIVVSIVMSCAIFFRERSVRRAKGLLS